MSAEPYATDLHTQVSELSEFGRLWAEANSGSSILARVALQGYDGEWPTQHTDTAIRVVNQRGAEVAGL